MAREQVPVRDGGPTSDRYTLVVAVANPATVEQLLRTATDLASANDGRIHLVSVAHKPPTSPFALFSEDRIRTEYASDQQAVLDAAESAASDSPVPVERHLLVDTDVANALLSAVDDLRADALLIGWRQRTRFSDVVLGTTVDSVLRRAPCDVYVERMGTTADGVESILVPTIGGPHLQPAASLASAIARANDARVEVVTYVSPDAGEADCETARAHLEAARRHHEGVPVDTQLLEVSDVAGSIVERADDHDLVVLGATRETRLGGRVVGSVARTVGERATPPVVIARASANRSLVDRIREIW